MKNYGRKAYSSESQTWSEKAYSDCSNWPVNPEFHLQNPCPVGFMFPFPSLRKGQCVVQAGELKGLSFPQCNPLLLLHWIGTWWAEVKCARLICQSFTRDHCFVVDFVGGRGREPVFSTGTDCRQLPLLWLKLCFLWQW